MNINLEQIDEMRKRTNCSYQEAKELLEKHDGDLIEAIIEFESKQGHKFKHNQNKHQKHDSNCKEKTKNLIQKGFSTRFIIEKGENTILNIPVNILILAVIFTIPMIWIYPVAFIVIYFMGYKIRIKKDEGQEVDVNGIMDEIGSKVKTATDSMRRNTTEKNEVDVQDDVKSEEKKEEGYNEIIIK